VSTTPYNYNLFVVITSQYYNYSTSIIGTVMEKSSTLDPKKIKIKRSMTSFAIFFMLQHFCTLTGRSCGMEKKSYCYYYTIIFFSNSFDRFAGGSFSYVVYNL